MSLSSNIKKAHPILWGGLAAACIFYIINKTNNPSTLENMYGVQSRKEKALIDTALRM